MITRKFQLDEKNRPRILLWVFAAGALLYHLGAEQLTATEQIYIKLVKEIWEKKDLFYPVLQSGSETPLWFLWSGTLTVGLGPQPLEHFLLRLPSVLAALAMLAVTLQLARKLYDRHTAAAAGWMIAGSCVFLYIGRLGVPLMTVSAISMLTVGSFFLEKSGHGAGKFYRFWLLFFCGAWSGGLSTQCAVLPFFLPFCFLRGLRKSLLSWHQIPAFLLGALLYLVPLAVVSDWGDAAGFGRFIWSELVRDFGLATPLRTSAQDLWFYCLLPFFALQIAALWAAVLHWKKLDKLTQAWGIGLLFAAGYWSVLPAEGTAPALLLPGGTVFFAAVLNSPAFAPCRTTVLKGTRLLAILTSAALLCSLCFFAAGQMLFRLDLWGGAAFRVAGCGLLGLLVMLLDELRPWFWSRHSWLSRDIAAQILCLALITATILCWVLPEIP
ncbi:MAG: hypothetical protein IKD46_01720 [Lentisphaeria bacterium]|nr:hypothetical protein [Lentisphaeria bacterium]